jgi:hypothetical protein
MMGEQNEKDQFMRQPSVFSLILICDLNTIDRIVTLGHATSRPLFPMGRKGNERHL